MTEQVTMQDGTKQDLIAHLDETHHKGTKGFTDAFLNAMHRSLHLQESDSPPEHDHPDIKAEAEEAEAEESQPAG